MGRTTRTSSRNADASKSDRGTQTAQPSPPLAEVRKIEAPTYFASNVIVGKVGNDAYLTFARWVPTAQPDGTPAQTALAEPVALIQMSLGTLKDLSLLVRGMVDQIERETGPIETDFTRQNRASSSGAN